MSEAARVRLRIGRDSSTNRPLQRAIRPKVYARYVDKYRTWQFRIPVWRDKVRERRSKPRFQCEDVLRVLWEPNDPLVNKHLEMLTNLENISAFGACLRLDRPIPTGAKVRLVGPGFQFRARVRHCAFRTIGYYVGLEFLPGEEWSIKEFAPCKLFNPNELGGLCGASEDRDLIDIWTADLRACCAMVWARSRKFFTEWSGRL